jgi:hypothetical protein
MASPDAVGGGEATLLDVRARPQGGQRVFILIIALLAGAAGFWLTQAVDGAARPSVPLAVGIGCGIALGVLFFAFQGARVVVAADGILTYSLHGRPNLSVAVSAVTAIRPINDGLVRGLGLEFADPQQVRFLHKAGISPERMRRWREQYGVDLVLEGFHAAVGERLETLRRSTQG